MQIVGYQFYKRMCWDSFYGKVSRWMFLEWKKGARRGGLAGGSQRLCSRSGRKGVTEMNLGVGSRDCAQPSTFSQLASTEAGVECVHARHILCCCDQILEKVLKGGRIFISIY